MRSNPNIEPLLDVFKDVPKPVRIDSCSQGCCGNDELFRQLLQVDRRDITQEMLLDFVMHYSTTVGTAADFKYLLPAILHTWSQAKPDEDGCGYIDYVFQAISGVGGVNKPGLPQLEAPLRDVADTFMKEVLLDQIQRTPPLHNALHHEARPVYRWVSELAAFGGVSNVLPILWKEWWALPDPGFSTAALQYLSCMLFSSDRNPIFSPWTRNGGGGPPCLWEAAYFPDGHLLWLKQNSIFLKSWLRVEQFEQTLAMMRSRHLADSETLDRFDKQLAENRSFVAERCAILPDFFAETCDRAELRRRFQWQS